MQEQQHISSLIAQVKPEVVEAIVTQCKVLENVDVPVVDPLGKLVVLLEMPSQRRIVEFIDWLQERPGVLSVNLVYHHVESAEELDREIGEIAG
ncbi:chaperone NapD [Halomonas sp. E19]|uniref:chaperone NapD n=1 Tax=unclassified Halomonas TaxID=2609666 RepID=UPI0040349074